MRTPSAAAIQRARLWRAQPPQGFPREMIVEAHRRARADGVAVTDDGALCERYGYPVRLIEGEVANLKVTTPARMATGTSVKPSQITMASPAARRRRQSCEERSAQATHGSEERTHRGFIALIYLAGTYH
mgnify:CR=1 FL=1